jgi:hypothetical protein
MATLIASIILSLSVIIVSTKSDKQPLISDKGIEKVVIIHYKAPSKPSWAGSAKDNPKEDEENSKLFRSGVKWSDNAL